MSAGRADHVIGFLAHFGPLCTKSVSFYLILRNPNSQTHDWVWSLPNNAHPSPTSNLNYKVLIKHFLTHTLHICTSTFFYAFNPTFTQTHTDAHQQGYLHMQTRRAGESNRCPSSCWRALSALWARAAPVRCNLWQVRVYSLYQPAVSSGATWLQVLVCH